MLGTAAYMSPEQARGPAVDHRSDIFSFGVTLYEMLTGRAAFQGQSSLDTMQAILTQPVPPLPGLAGSSPDATADCSESSRSPPRRIPTIASRE